MQTEIPDGDYKLSKDGLWVTRGNVSIRISPYGDEGIDIAVYAIGKEGGEPLKAMSVSFNEAKMVLDSFSHAKDAIQVAKQTKPAVMR